MPAWLVHVESRGTDQDGAWPLGSRTPATDAPSMTGGSRGDERDAGNGKSSVVAGDRVGLGGGVRIAELAEVADAVVGGVVEAAGVEPVLCQSSR